MSRDESRGTEQHALSEGIDQSAIYPTLKEPDKGAAPLRGSADDIADGSVAGTDPGTVDGATAYSCDNTETLSRQYVTKLLTQLRIC